MSHFIEIAKALKPVKQTGRFFHVTFVCRKRKTLAIGINDYRKLNDAKKWGEYVPLKNADSEYIAGIHSEISALIKNGIEDCSDLDFYNIRITNSNQIAMSKPCGNCQRVLKQVGYKNFYYFDDEIKICKL